MRTIVWYIYFWIYQLFLLPIYFIIGSLFKKNKIEKAEMKTQKIATNWAKRLVSLSGSKIEIIGAENISKDQAVVFVSNHQSSFDIPILLGFLNKSMGFVAKAEIKKMPVIGGWMKYMKCVFLERTDPRAALKSIKEGIEIVKNGQSLVIFPEGTRSIDGEIQEFKSGSFKLALKSNAPVIPITIKGSIDIMKKGSMKIKPAKVTVIISEPIDTSEYKFTESYLLREKVYEIIKSNLN